MKGVTDIHHIHVWAMSTTENALTAHIQLKENMTEEEKQKLLGEVKHDLLHYNIHHTTLEMEVTHCADEACSRKENNHHR